ncbi:MAG: transcription activator effector-binding protein, partial [Winogradskyella sp.]|nr:transcription activator effector-binding protein [Winogradskyella sp.]
LIGFSIYVAVQPNEFDVQRKRTIQAPAAVIYNNVNDYKNWNAWSSWIEKNPDTKVTYPEQTSGVGGSYYWEDDDGKGSMTTVDTDPVNSITQEMRFEDFPPSTVNWTFDAIDNTSTEVTWQMTGADLPFMMKFFSVISGGYDAMMGPDFERGLEKLDSIIVADINRYSVAIEGVANHGGGYYIYNTASSKITDYQSKVQELFPRVGAYAVANNITMAGPAFQIVHKWDEENNAVIFSCAVPTVERIVSSESDILTGKLEPFKAIKTILKGNYDNLSEAWQKTMSYIEANGHTLIESGPMLEAYITDPMEEPNPANWITEIYVAIE